MPKCRNCNETFPNVTTINGKKKNLSSRRYCLVCSPFGEHNTKKIHEEAAQFECKRCGRTDVGQHQRTGYCYSCMNKRREAKKCRELYGITGTACWVCGYDKGQPGIVALDFHHIHGKDFGLTRRNIGQLSWKRLLEEAKKCILVCCRCHREIHGGLIDAKYVLDLHESEWACRSAVRSPP